MFIADSTLAWAAEWLFNYEVWKATGEWSPGRPAPELDIELTGEAKSPAGPVPERRWETDMPYNALQHGHA